MPFSSSNGVDIWFETRGEGPSMVLVHANPFDHDLWLYQVAHFSTWFRVVSIDIRGYGRSAKVTTPYSEADMCDDVLGVMDDLGIDRAVLGGCSVGSGIAIHLGQDHPDRFDALFLVGGNAGASERYMKRVEGYTRDLAGYHLGHMRQLVAPDFAESELGGYLLKMWVEREPRLEGAAIARVFHAGNGTDSTPGLERMRLPTLVVNGEFDHSMKAGRRTAAAIPGAVHKVVPNAGHACCIEDPATFDRIVIEFLRTNKLMPSL